jgi:hypothetical protein
MINKSSGISIQCSDFVGKEYRRSKAAEPWEIGAETGGRKGELT